MVYDHITRRYKLVFIFEKHEFHRQAKILEQGGGDFNLKMPNLSRNN